MEMTEYRKPRSQLSTLPTLLGNPFGIITFPRPRLGVSRTVPALAWIHLCGIALRVRALCGIWANRKSFLLAPRRYASQSGRYPIGIRTALYGRLRQSTTDSAR